MASQDSENPSHAAFEDFVQAQTCKDVKHHFAELCKQLELNPKDFRSFYAKLKERLNYWKAKALWTKLDKRAAHPDYQQGKVCAKNKVILSSKRMLNVFPGFIFGSLYWLIFLFPFMIYNFLPFPFLLCKWIINFLIITMCYIISSPQFVCCFSALCEFWGNTDTPNYL